MSKHIINQSRLKEVLHYDPATGLFTWLERGPGRNFNKSAGSISSRGYRRISVDNKVYQAHRLVWLYTFGYFPDQIDHIDHNRENNSLLNLREASCSVNTKNQSLRKNNTSGVVGVSPVRLSGFWRVQIYTGGKCFYNRDHNSFHKAVAIRKALEVVLGYHPNHGT